MMPQDFYHRPLTAGMFMKLLLFGLFAALLCVPLASAMHAFGHAFFGMAAGCEWIGILLPFTGHSQSVVNFPSNLFPASGAYGWLAFGGFLWVGVLLIVVLSFPSADELPQNLFLQVLGFHLAFWGFLKEALSVWPDGELAIRSTGRSLWSDPGLGVPVLVGFLFAALFASRAVRILGQGVHFTLFTPLFLGLALWFLPAGAAVALLFLDGASLTMIIVLGSTVLAFLLLSPLLRPGIRLWREPVFSRWLYGLLLVGGMVAMTAVVVLGWGRGSEPILWGTLKNSTTQPVGVTP